MNLAHVERYFADALSGMESRTPVLPNLVEDNGWWRLRAGGPRLIPLPRNLFVIGTVNVDETTYMFSPKVLDRGNTIEFRVATDDLRVDALKPTPVTPGEALLVKGFLAAATDDNFQVAQPSSNRDEVAEKLRDLHRALSRYGFEWAHRTFYEMLRYAALLEACGETDQWAALDQQVKQKVLPHFHGSAQRLTRPLAVVARFCFDLGIDDEHEAGSFVVGDVSTDAALPQSFDKVRRMTGTLLENHFTGFAE